ncbi:MAG: MarR family winged helix-turn-helix transcriptional regulator [Desulfobacteraceae bacterium]|nr:MarR family winged helix-turn-helix transcriptional regulator [Desulfobacteraceae bacterium]
MNKNGNTYEQKFRISEYQLSRLNVLIEDIRRCCEDRQLFEAGKFGLPYSEIRCLMLFGSERYLTVKGIAEQLEVAKSRVTKLVNSMNEKGLIESAVDPADGRVRLLRLTPEGRRAVERIKDFQKQMQAKILEKLDPAGRNRVISGLELLRSAMLEAKAEMEGGEKENIQSFKQTNEVDHV